MIKSISSKPNFPTKVSSKDSNKRTINLTVAISESELRNLFNEIESKESRHQNKTQSKSIFNLPECYECLDKTEYLEDFRQGILICKNCGQVLDVIYDHQPEWRNFEDDKDNSRCGMAINLLLPQSSLGTQIGGGGWKNRVKTIHNWSAIPYKERSLSIVFKEIHNRCQQSGILKCIEDDAKILYKNISESKYLEGKKEGRSLIIRGANRKSLIAACLFFACKKKGVTRSPRELAELFEIKYTDMTKGCKNLQKIINLQSIEINTGSSQPEHFVERFCKELRIKTIYAEKAIQISKNINKLNIASVHTPFSIAMASIILMIENNNDDTNLSDIINKRYLAKKFGVSEVTIMKTLKTIEKYKDVVINNNLTDSKLIQINLERKNFFVPNDIIKRCEKFSVPLDYVLTPDMHTDYLSQKFINFTPKYFNLNNKAKLTIDSDEEIVNKYFSIIES